MAARGGIHKLLLTTHKLIYTRLLTTRGSTTQAQIFLIKAIRLITPHDNTHNKHFRTHTNKSLLLAFISSKLINHILLNRTNRHTEQDITTAPTHSPHFWEQIVKGSRAWHQPLSAPITRTCSPNNPQRQKTTPQFPPPQAIGSGPVPDAADQGQPP